MTDTTSTVDYATAVAVVQAGDDKLTSDALAIMDDATAKLQELLKGYTVEGVRATTAQTQVQVALSNISMQRNNIAPVNPVVPNPIV